MNVAGLVLGRASAYACASHGSLFDSGTQHWLCGDDALPLLFRDWVGGLAEYDEVRLWNPADLSVPALYRLTLAACGDKLRLVSARELRLACGLTLPTGRDYQALAQSRGGKRGGTVEESIAVLLATGEAAPAE